MHNDNNNNNATYMMFSSHLQCAEIHREWEGTTGGKAW